MQLPMDDQKQNKTKSDNGKRKNSMKGKKASRITPGDVRGNGHLCLDGMHYAALLGQPPHFQYSKHSQSNELHSKTETE